MRNAIGTFNGWRCPECKRLVKTPTRLNMGYNIADGECKYCGTVLRFEKVNVLTGPPEEIASPIEMKKESSFKETKEPLNIKQVFEKYYETMFEKYIMPKIILDNGRWVWVNFLNRPQFLKKCEEYAKANGLLLSEVIIGFAAKGYKDMFLTKEK